MQIVTDTGADIYLPHELMPEVDIHVVRHSITLNNKTYLSGEDIRPEELQKLLLETGSFPITSQPSAGHFAAVYKRLAATDPDILSIHMSSGLSGVVNAARAGAEMTPEANVTVVDTKTLSGVLGWQVAAAARALKAGWSKDKILILIKHIGNASESLYTLSELKYLIHGGRISHMKGLIASLLHICPLIGVEKVGGTYSQLGMSRTFEQAISGLVKLMTKQYAPGTALRVQVLHSYNPQAATILREKIAPLFQCDWMPVSYISPVLAAHTGPSMVGVGYAPLETFIDIP